MYGHEEERRRWGAFARTTRLIVFASVFAATTTAAFCAAAVVAEDGPRAADVVCQGCAEFDPQVGSDGLDEWRANYNTFWETFYYLTNLVMWVDLDDYMSIFPLGISPAMDMDVNTASTTYDPALTSQMLVVRVTEDAQSTEEYKPALLLICGHHAHEWIPQETCLGLVDYYVKAANGEDPYAADMTHVRDLLAERELWFIVNANPAGRMIDDQDTSDGYDRGPNNKRKNQQWNDEDGFVCGTDWHTQDYAGLSGDSVYWNSENGKKGDWWSTGINLDTAFSSRWANGSDYPYGRDLIHGDPGAWYLSPSQFVCWADSGLQVDSDAACVNQFGAGTIYGKCLRYRLDGGVRSGCFPHVDTATTIDGYYPYSAAGLTECRARRDALASFTEFVSSTASCLATLDDGGFLRFVIWECGEDTSIADADFVNAVEADDVHDPVDPDLPTAYTGSGGNPKLMRFCHRGILQSCAQDSDCGTSGGLSWIDYFVKIPKNGNDYYPPHLMYDNTLMDDHIYCTSSAGAPTAYHHCAVDARRSCGAKTFGGRRPFEATEARALRDLVNNVPFSMAVTMHSSRADFMYSCAAQLPGGGCNAVDNERLNGMAMGEEFTTLVNAASMFHWNASYPKHTTPGYEFPDAMKLVNRSPSAFGNGNPGAWLVSKVAAQSSSSASTSDKTDLNFDLGTVRGIPTYLWELGTNKDRKESSVSALFDELEGCNAGGNDGSKPYSRLFVENQLTGAIWGVTYLAQQLKTPNVGKDQGGAFLDGARRDVALLGLRVHDLSGRGVQQSELRYDHIGDDFTAEILIPAGRWAISFDYAYNGMMDGQAELSLSVEETSLHPYGPNMLMNNLFIDPIPPGSRETLTRVFDFEPGETYMIRASVPSGVTFYNDTAANDELVAKVKVVDCQNTFSIPNGLDSDEFCAKGLPFDNDRFECWDGAENPFGYGRCRECWSDAYDEQGCDGLAGFCFEGLCDDSQACWSGHLEDVYEEEGNGESPVRVHNNGNQTNTIVRSLFRQPDPVSGQVLDVDSLDILPESPVATMARYLTMRVHNHCRFLTSPLDLPMDEVEVKLQRMVPILPVPEIASYEDITGWEHPARISGLTVTLTDEEIAAFSGGYPFRVQVRNDGMPLEEFTYTLEVKMASLEMIFVPGDYIPIPKPGESLVWPMSVISLSSSVGEAAFVSPAESTIASGGWLHFAPEEGVDVGAVSFVLRDSRGEIAVDEHGLRIGEATPLHGGLAIPLDDLTARYAPYSGTIVGLRGEKVEGRVFVCPSGINDCSTYEPTRDICGAGDDEICCVDDNGGYFALHSDGDDPDNCGACGLACEWDETCLRGTCVGGDATRCWNTDCPAGTFCISDGWFGADPRCEAILVDREHCGWFEDECTYDEQCLLGFCLPRLLGECDLACREGEACCWKLGVETCVDVSGGFFDCGGCGNVCDNGQLCSAGVCTSWYNVVSVCGAQAANCDPGDGLECVGVLDDEEHCGACTISCAPTAQCVDGVCTEQATRSLSLEEE